MAQALLHASNVLGGHTPHAGTLLTLAYHVPPCQLTRKEGKGESGWPAAFTNVGSHLASPHNSADTTPKPFG